MFTKIENIRSFIHLYPVVCGLILIQTITFIICLLHTNIFYTLIGHNEAILHGEYWRIITPLFVHLSFHHFFSNIFPLLLLGPFLEGYIRKVPFIFLYICTGLAGNIVTFLLKSPFYIHAGSSGAIFGMFSAYLYFFYTNEDNIPSHEKRLFLLLILSNIFLTFTLSNINVVAHLTGLISGSLLIPFLLRTKYKSKLHFK
jgi:rhomboid protease GluP